MSLLKARLLPCLLEYNMKSQSFSFSNDEAGRFAKHRKQHYIRYGEQRLPALKANQNVTKIIKIDPETLEEIEIPKH
jgi:hypothetical protein